MGRIKSLMVKKAARQLLENNADFTDSFEHNKKSLRGLMHRKPIQNKIAGYIGRLIKAKKAEKALADKKTSAIVSQQSFS